MTSGGCPERMDPWRVTTNTNTSRTFRDIGEGSGELARKFFDYYASVFAEGALTVREKALIALAVAHAVQCPYCIDAYSTECVHQGADLEEMTEAVHVATAIRGGASLVHGLQMLEHVTQIDDGGTER